MSVQIKDILKLNIFRNSKIIAGEKGLNRVIKRVSVFDCPIQEDRDKIVLNDGDFFISNFYYFKSSVEYSIYAIDFLNNCNSSGLCITNEYLDFFSDELKEYCNKINFPVITIDSSTSYGDIIKDISYLIFKSEKNELLELKLLDLIDSVSFVSTKNLLNTINPHFKEFLTVFYFYSECPDFQPNSNFLNLLNKNKYNNCIPYQNGYMLIISYSNKDISNINITLSYYIDIIKNNMDRYIIGISENFINLYDVKTAISQAILSSSCSKLLNSNLITYNDLDIIPILYKCKDTDEVKRFYYDKINIIKEYDKAYNKNLLSTLISFVEDGGDYKACSNRIFQHENTIRYRISKVRSLLALEGSLIEFHEKISLLIKLHKIYNN